jgi:hypothetical protein
MIRYKHGMISFTKGKGLCIAYKFDRIRTAKDMKEK